MVIGDLLRLMRVLYGSVMDAFMNFSNHSELNCLLALFFHSLGLSQSHSETPSRKLQISLDTSLCSHIPYLPLSTQDAVSTLCCLNTECRQITKCSADLIHHYIQYFIHVLHFIDKTKGNENAFAVSLNSLKGYSLLSCFTV